MDKNWGLNLQKNTANAWKRRDSEFHTLFMEKYLNNIPFGAQGVGFLSHAVWAKIQLKLGSRLLS